MSLSRIALQAFLCYRYGQSVLGANSVEKIWYSCRYCTGSELLSNFGYLVSMPYSSSSTGSLQVLKGSDGPRVRGEPKLEKACFLLLRLILVEGCWLSAVHLSHSRREFVVTTRGSLFGHVLYEVLSI